jgi:hypothetical protein
VGEMDKGRSLSGNRKHKPNTMNFALMANIQGVYQPQFFEKETRKTEWENEMKIEHESLMKNQTLNLTDLSPRKKSTNYKWVYKANDTLDKYKA